MLSSGQAAPDFTLPDPRGGVFRLSAARGHPVVLAFYCEDDSDGCIMQNREFSERAEAFAALGIEMVAISPQDAASHSKFSKKYGFAQPLLADTDLVAHQGFGVWQLKKLWGREYMGTIRVTFLIDAHGIVTGVFPARRIKGHAETVLEAARGLVAAPKA